MPFGIGVAGAAQSFMKFPKVVSQPGETYWELLERHARQVKTDMGETSTGELWLNPMSGGGSVIEGYNILVGREVIHSLKSVGEGSEGGDFTSMGQRPGTDDSWGADANRVNAEQGAITTDFNKGFLAKVGLSETPAWSTNQMQDRSKFESSFADTLQIWVTCTLLTWQRSGKVPPSGGLWRPGDQVTVMSPMLVLYGRSLKLKAVTFTQDNSTGTRSTVELVNALALGVEPAASPGPSGGNGGNGGSQ
jgi:prophage tail gpP-like protein